MQTEMLVDEKCIEITVSYQKFEDSSVFLKYVEVVIAGSSVNILPQLTEKQQRKIIENLSNEPTYEI